MTNSRPTTRLIDIEMELQLLGDEICRLIEAPVPDEEAINTTLTKYDAYLVSAKEKRDNFVIFLKYVQDQAEHRAKLAKEKAIEAKTLDNLAERLKKYAVKVMELAQVKQLEGHDWTIKHHTNSQPTLIIPDEASIPRRFFDEVITLKLNRDRIREAIRSGDTADLPPEVARLEQGAHMRIK